MNKLTYNGKVYDDVREGTDKLMSASGYIGDSLPAVQLSVDTLTAVVRDYGLQERLFMADGMLLAAGGVLLAGHESAVGLDKDYVYGADVKYHHGNDLIGKFRLESIKREGQYAYRLNCVSDIGLLLTSEHRGGIYTGQKMSEVLSEIIGGVVPYTLDDELGQTVIYGWLPKTVRRDNLRDLLFAVGGQIRKDTAGQINIVPMVAGNPYEISADEFYMGGSVTGGNPATGVNVTEHAFMALPNDPDVTLFDGNAAGEEIITPMGKAVTGVLVDFQTPMHDLVVENAEILESNANYAVISNSVSALLVGKQYTHTTRVISRRASSGIPNIVTSSKCTLVSMLNAELVADRLMAYYSAARTVEADLVVQDQKPGDAVRFTDPFGDEAEGYIADMELNMSAIIKARMTLVTGYIPTASGNYYANVMVITANQTVTIPADAKEKAILVLIGGGDGGGIGEAGQDGAWDATTSNYGSAGRGGLPGVPGAGGKIFVGTIPVRPGQSFTATIGKGGKGETRTSAGTKGGATTFGSYSSENGFPSPTGYVNLLNGDLYATPGDEGVPGGAGVGKNFPAGETVIHKGVTYTPGAAGENDSTARGGLGGGPAAGAHGERGRDGEMNPVLSGGYQALGGDGGDGATPVKADNGKVPGAGGGAGHGGGGGGGGGPATGGSAGSPQPGVGGDGGDPGEGGDGCDGIILLYY